MQQIPPDTSNAYMLLGYAIVILILAGLVVYLVGKARRLRSEIKMLETLNEHDDSKPIAKK